MTLIGRVYKLSASNCDKIYIGSTYSKYASVRLAHHRQAHRNKWKDYAGLFDNGDPEMEILEEIELNDKDEAWKLRKLENEHVNKYDNCMNIRRSYLNAEEKIKMLNENIKKYHSTPLGQLALRKSVLNAKIKKIENNSYKKVVHPSTLKQIKNELNFICDQQELMREATNGGDGKSLI